MRWFKKFGKIFVFDTLAIFCFIGVILFGWLPGPGGIPLFLLGLSLLAVNHDWAEHWLETAKHKGVTFKKWLFPDVQWIRHTYDFLSVSVMIAGGILLCLYDNRFVEGFAVVIIISSLFIFLINRDRLDKFADIFKRIRQKKP